MYRYAINKYDELIGLESEFKSKRYIDSEILIEDFIHPCGMYRYKVVEGQINVINLSQELKFKSWKYEKVLYPIVKDDFLNSYGSFGKLGCLIADAKARLNNLTGINVFIDEMRSENNEINPSSFDNIEYSGDYLDESEKGFWYVINPEADAVILTKSLDCSYNVFYVCLVGVIFEYGYQIQDILLEYRKGNGNWNFAYPEGKKPYSVYSKYSKIEISGNENIQLRLTLKTGNNDTNKHAFLVSFAIVGE